MRKKRKRSSYCFAFILFSTLFHFSIFAKTVHYELTATQGQINLSGKKTVDFAILLNQQIPAPTLEFTEGDEAEIVVKNRLPKDELSIHWHGILLPTEMDGVPYVTTPPILSGEDFTFRFKIRQHGTYWYHSHTNVQEQKGVFGAFIIHPKKETIQYDKDLVVVLSDWADEDPNDILKNLRKDGDYYLHKKGTVRSWLGALQAGALGHYLYNEWTRMGGMDLSDVGYDAFLINGKQDSQLLVAHPGERIRLRIINAAASSYFHIALGQTSMKVISVDGIDIVPIKTQEILSGMAETHDVLFEVPEHKNYELKITAQDGTGSASGWIGMGKKVYAPVKLFPDMYASMDHSGHDMSKMGMEGHAGHNMTQTDDHSGHDMGMDMDMDSEEDHSAHEMKMKEPTSSQAKTVQTLSVDDLKAIEKTSFPPNKKTYELKLVLGGDMGRYIWFINGKSISEDRNITIEEGDVVRFILENQTMMHHPMHLHGHFFRVLNKNGAYSPLKHTVDVPPHSTRTIEFLANEPGEWMLHCHNLYHLKTGMARVVKYMSYTPSEKIGHYQKHDPHLHDHWYSYGKVEAATNIAEAYFRVSQTWNQFELRIEGKNPSQSFTFDKEWEFSGDLFYRRWINQYFNLIAGGTSFDDKLSAVAGIGYMLPLLIESNILINHKGKFRFDLKKEFQWTSAIFTDAELIWRPDQGYEFGKDIEHKVTLMYSKNWSWAAGLFLTKESLGVGARFQF